MKKYLEILQRCSLFENIDPNRLLVMLQNLGVKRQQFAKGQQVFFEGDPAKEIGIVLSGQVQVVKEDYYGNRNLVALIEPSQLFGEAFACAGVEALPVSVVAVCESDIMLIRCERIIAPQEADEFHNQLVHNLLYVVASKNLILSRKIELISKRTTKEKLMAYLLSEAKCNGTASFRIPYNRQELADYLGVERSAMSAELSKLKKEGKINFHKNNFVIL